MNATVVSAGVAKPAGYDTNEYWKNKQVCHFVGSPDDSPANSRS